MPCPTPISLFFLLRHHRTSSLLLLLSPRSTSTLAHNRHPCPPSSSSDVDLLRKQEEQRQALQNPYDLMKEDPIQVCSDLWVRCFGRPADAPPLPNLTGFLKKFDLWVLAYQRACAHHTGSFPPRGAIHLPHLRSLLALQVSVLASPRRPHPWGASTHLLLRSPVDPPSTRPISRRKFQALLDAAPPPFQDRVLQELLLLLLEPAFEPRFSPKSHAFRPGRSPHTVLRTLRSHFAGYLWFLKADLSSVADGLGTDVILRCVERGVSDRKVLSLIKSALRTPVKAGSLPRDQEVDRLTKKRMKRKMLRKRRKKKVLNENEPKPDPYWLRTFFGFAPREATWVPNYGHCGILSPLLANICLSELDYWMEERIAKYFRASKLDSIWKESINDGSHNPAWPEFVPSSGNEKTRKMDYIRYGSHILIGIRGPREDAVELRKALIEFCEITYGLRLENSETEIEHITRGIEFLDHVICRRVIHPTLRYTATGGNIISQKGVGTLLSITASMQQCIRKFRRLELVKGDKDPEPLPCTPMLYSGQAHTNSQMNKFLETMADWYKYADNRKKVVGFCGYVIRSSLAKLYAARYRLKSRAKVYKIASRDLSHPLRESSRNDAPEFSDLLRMGLVDAIDGIQFSHMSLIPSCDYIPFPRNWVPDHELVLREYIKLQDPKFFCELHKSIKQQELSSPQDDISKVVWDYKVFGVWSKSQRTTKEQGKLEEGANACRVSCAG
ncbi:nuclear intron maturase 1, mitochondrial [Musa acuminata AAA Group]|uniref:nuclear intron maturase 1, mitochondrial n=1 Tax=Musa acuminata AAA Group TaxID=214697 RepID=UPI0031D4F404